jgi:serine/threonine protein kinase
LVECLSSPQPVFFRRENEEAFFVRTGNGTQPLRPSEILAYLERRQTDPQPVVPLFAKEGQRLGQYAIDERIGAGAVGVVYRGHHALLHRPTAIKLLDPNRADEKALGRFEREVQLTSQLNHPNTIAIYDYGRTSEGVFYYVMEYLDGITLEELVNMHGPQPAGRVIHVLRQVCGALAEAHELGLIHRDIKPANIMINYRGGLYDFVKLLDFGLVKAVDASEQVALTAAGAITGTPLYLAPEAIEGSRSLDARSDLYALGAVGYFLLAGTPVFAGQSLMEVCMKHAHTAPSPPSKKRGESISEDLETIILKCLEKDPALRPQSARDLNRSLASCRATAEWTEEQAAAWWHEEYHKAPAAPAAPRERPSVQEHTTVSSQYDTDDLGPARKRGE